MNGARPLPRPSAPAERRPAVGVEARALAPGLLPAVALELLQLLPGRALQAPREAPQALDALLGPGVAAPLRGEAAARRARRRARPARAPRSGQATPAAPTGSAVSAATRASQA